MKVPVYLKITFVLCVIIAATLTGLFIYFNKSLERYAYSGIKDNFVKNAYLSGFLLEEHLRSSPNTVDMDKIAGEIGDRLKVRATIIDTSGKVLGDSEMDGRDLEDMDNHLSRVEIDKALKGGVGHSRRFSTTLGKDMLYVASPYGRDGVRGVIRLSVPLGDVETITLSLKRAVTVALFIAFSAAVAVSFLAAVFISRPIREISRTAGHIAAGDFGKKVFYSARDEIGDLAKAFNYMSEQIEKRVREALVSKARMEAVLFSMFEGIMVVDARGTISLMNQALRNFLKVDDNFLDRKPIEAVRNIGIQEIVDHVLNREAGVMTREETLLLPEEKIVLIHAAPVLRGEKMDGAVLVFHDITELRGLENIRRDFVANVSHELRTPVTNIKGYAETLMRGALADGKNAYDFVEVINSEAGRLAKLIEDLLDISRLESEGRQVSLKPCAIKPIVERVVAGFRQQAEEKSIGIRVDIPADIPEVLGDELMISQVLLNLIDNALKYNREKGTVSITAETGKKFVRVEVSDTGIGIPSEDLLRIFERFYRVDKARSRALGGTGLGLSIVKHVVHALGGEVIAGSVLNHGSKFSFTLPSLG